MFSLAQRPAEGFGRPVESIMKCEDFKSNFARKLSNRYLTRSPLMRQKSEASTRLFSSAVSPEKTSEILEERIAPLSPMPKLATSVHIGETAKAPSKAPSGGSDKRKIEVAALNMEVETLKWQLSQTEANRQMHIALLKQIVSFLNRVKEKIESKEETANRSERVGGKVLANSFSSADLSRSVSVVQMNKSLEYSPNCTKKVSSRKISKSISNVNGFKELNNAWNQSKLSLTSETESTKKITEEMSRLITLANTVLSTNLPDLANAYDKHINEPKINYKPEKETRRKYGSTVSLNRIEEDIVHRFTCNGNDNIASGDFNSDLSMIGPPCNEYDVTPPAAFTSEDEIASVELNEVEHYNIGGTNNVIENNKKNGYNRPVNFIEDESGFSSMSSFQEIGIPIINIIPPSPCKGMGYDNEMPDILEEHEKLKTESLQLDKQAVKVFWV